MTDTSKSRDELLEPGREARLPQLCSQRLAELWSHTALSLHSAYWNTVAALWCKESICWWGEKQWWKTLPFGHREDLWRSLERGLVGVPPLAWLHAMFLHSRNMTNVGLCMWSLEFSKPIAHIHQQPQKWGSWVQPGVLPTRIPVHPKWAEKGWPSGPAGSSVLSEDGSSEARL